MSQTFRNFIDGMWGFPRVSGDEPVPLKYGQETTVFSPRERG